jgi:hypothetical protein
MTRLVSRSRIIDALGSRDTTLPALMCLRARAATGQLD